jgi:hypothetical protein
MSFVSPRERFLLMDYETVDGILMGSDDLKALYDAGIHTAVMFTNPWGTVEPRMGRYDWSSIDRYLERVGRHGYKTLIACYSEGPRWLPLEWCAETSSGKQAGVVSPWNKDAVDYQLGFYQAMHDRYTIPGLSMVYNSWITNGETMFLNEPAWYDRAAIASYHDYTGCNHCDPEKDNPETEAWFSQTLIDFLLKQQAILVDNPDREVWTAAHPVLAQIYGNGCRYIELYLKAMLDTLRPVSINHIFYTWLQWPGMWQHLDYLRETYGEIQWGGAEYCEGLDQSAPLGIANGLRGHIIGPLHPYTGHKHIEPWMVEKIKWALREWEAAPAGIV